MTNAARAIEEAQRGPKLAKGRIEGETEFKLKVNARAMTECQHASEISAVYTRFGRIFTGARYGLEQWSWNASICRLVYTFVKQ